MVDHPREQLEPVRHKPPSRVRFDERTKGSLEVIPIACQRERPARSLTMQSQ